MRRSLRYSVKLTELQWTVFHDYKEDHMIDKVVHTVDFGECRKANLNSGYLVSGDFLLGYVGVYTKEERS